MQKYRVTYVDGRVQEVAADNYMIEGSFLIFRANGAPILTIKTDRVESVAEASVPKATLAMPKARAV